MANVIQSSLNDRISAQDVQLFMQKEWSFDKLNVTIQGSIKNTATTRQNSRGIFKEIT